MPFRRAPYPMASKVVGMCGSISLKSVKNLLRGIWYAAMMKEHYSKSPKSADGCKNGRKRRISFGRQPAIWRT